MIENTYVSYAPIFHSCTITYLNNTSNEGGTYLRHLRLRYHPVPNPKPSAVGPELKTEAAADGAADAAGPGVDLVDLGVELGSRGYRLHPKVQGTKYGVSRASALGIVSMLLGRCSIARLVSYWLGGLSAFDRAGS